jgi:DNA-binding response OmpR family regulator
MKKVRILVVDDDPAIRKFVKANLEARDYEVFLANDGEEGISLIEQELPDLILLDIMMPNVDGFEVCRQVREWSKIPIVILSAREGELDKVKCLDCGADDYITKPFSLRELLSRIKAVLRRTHENESTSLKLKYRFRDLEVDLSKNMVFINGREIDLTGIENKILSYLTINSGRVITPDQILEKVWGEEYIGDDHLLQSNISRLRRKLNDQSKNPKYIQTKIGIGYSMSTE